MSSDAAKRGGALVVGLLVALTLSGCGFQPLYGERGATNIAAQIGALDVNVETGDGDLGRWIKYELLDSVSGAGSTADKPAYRVDLRPSFYEQDVAIQRDAEVTRRNVIVMTNFRLVDSETGKQLFRSVSRSRTSYNRVESEFANITASQDALRRTAKAVADDIKLQIALYFDRQASRKEP